MNSVLVESNGNITMVAGLVPTRQPENIGTAASPDAQERKENNMLAIGFFIFALVIIIILWIYG